jgi:hypothetical protein
MFGQQSSIFPHSPQTCPSTYHFYDEIVQALVAEADVLLPKPFLDLGFDGVVKRKSPASEMFSQFAKQVDVRRGPSWGRTVGGGAGGFQKWLREQDVSFYRQGLENLIVRYDKCLKGMGTTWKYRGMMSKDIRTLYLHLPPFT